VTAKGERDVCHRKPRKPKRGRRHGRTVAQKKRGVTFSAPLETPWGVKPPGESTAEEGAPVQSDKASFVELGGESTWCGEVAADVCSLAATAATSGPHSHALPPRSVAEALARQDAHKWQAAIDAELGSCRSFGVWDERDLPTGKQALPSFFIFEIKRDGRYKARLVAGGHRQQQGLDYDDTYASVASYRTLRMMMAISAHEDLELRQFDVSTAFLNGMLKEEVYLRPPVGLEGIVGQVGRVLKLNRAIYGLRQASRAWNQRLEGELSSRGFMQSDADPSLWILRGKGGAVLSLFYVDDGLVAARTAAEADALVALMASIFAIRELGEPEDFVGIEITRDRKARRITLTQEAKARALAAEYGVLGTRRSVPMSPESYSELRKAQPGEPMADKLAYQRAIGSLLHLAQCTRPDIALPVGALAAYASAPTQGHFEAVVEVVRYVGCTAERGIGFGGSARPVGFWCDANFAACQDTRRSTTGWVVVMYGGAVSWASKKQPTTAASTMDAEYQACGAAAREGLSLRKALKDMAFLCADLSLVGSIEIACDNKAALSLCKDRKEGQRVKHIDVIHHFARDRVATGELHFVYCKSEDNVSDCLTKALPRTLFDKGLLGMGMLV
jgi:hypothetical protein